MSVWREIGKTAIGLLVVLIKDAWEAISRRDRRRRDRKAQRHFKIKTEKTSCTTIENDDKTEPLTGK